MSFAAYWCECGRPLRLVLLMVSIVLEKEEKEKEGEGGGGGGGRGREERGGREEEEEKEEKGEGENAGRWSLSNATHSQDAQGGGLAASDMLRDPGTDAGVGLLRLRRSSRKARADGPYLLTNITVRPQESRGNESVYFDENGKHGGGHLGGGVDGTLMMGKCC